MGAMTHSTGGSLFAAGNLAGVNVVDARFVSTNGASAIIVTVR